MSEQESGWWEFWSPVRAVRLELWSPSFAGLVQLMIGGPGGEDHLCGQVSARILGSRPVMFGSRIARRGVLVRCEDLDGRIHFIVGRDTVWSCGPTGQLATRPRRPRDNPAIDDFEFGCARPTQNRWDGDDFTVPTGPPNSRRPSSAARRGRSNSPRRPTSPSPCRPSSMRTPA